MTDPKLPKIVAIHRPNAKIRTEAAPSCSGSQAETASKPSKQPGPGTGPSSVTQANWSSAAAPYVTAACAAAIALLDFQLALLYRQRRSLERRLQKTESELYELQELAAGLARVEDPLQALRLQAGYIEKVVDRSIVEGAAGIEDLLLGLSGGQAQGEAAAGRGAVHVMQSGSKHRH